jgi:hypothetical protein
MRIILSHNRKKNTAPVIVIEDDGSRPDLSPTSAHDGSRNITALQSIPARERWRDDAFLNDVVKVTPSYMGNPNARIKIRRMIT